MDTSRSAQPSSVQIVAGSSRRPFFATRRGLKNRFGSHLGGVAQFERELIRERVSAGMKAARRHGTRTGNAIGRPKRIFDRSEVVRLRQSGLAIEKRCEAPSLPARNTVSLARNSRCTT